MFSQYRRVAETANRQPIKCNVVEHIVARQALRLPGKVPRDERVAAGIMVEDPGGQADRGIGDPV